MVYYRYMFRDQKKVQRIFTVLAICMVLAMVALAVGPALFGQ